MSRSRVAVLYIVVLGMLVLTAACASGRRTPEYQSGFSALPANCSDALDPVEPAIRDFMGDLYGSDPELDLDVRDDYGYSQDLYCGVKYSESLPDASPGPYRLPMMRSVRISYRMFMSPQPVRATTTALREQVAVDEDRSALESLSGIGDDAISWVEQLGPRTVQIGVRFRLANLSVTVLTSGQDWPEGLAGFPVGDTRELRQDLSRGAESIAEAIVRHAKSALPTTVLSGQPTTKRPATTTSTDPRPEPVWDPCQIPDEDIAAAGLDPKSRDELSRGQGSAMCQWNGEWYQVTVDSSWSSAAAQTYASDTYVRPEFVMVKGRPALTYIWGDSDYFCDMAFEIEGNPESQMHSGFVVLEASANEEGRLGELCGELDEVANALVGAVPLSK